MTLRYVLTSFRRRKVRTVLMVLSLMVSTGLIVAMSATVETFRRSTTDVVLSEIGRYDLSIRRAETSPEQFITVADASQRVMAADDQIVAVYPRFRSEVDLLAGRESGRGWLLALDPAENIGRIDVVSGRYRLGDMQAAVLENTALALGDLRVGDTIEVAYRFPQAREKGTVAEVGSSQRRAIGRFEISAIVRQSGIANVNEGVIISLADAQQVLGQPGRAEELIALVEPALYEAGNSEAVALRMRDVGVNVQAALGDQYTYRMEKAVVLNEAAQAFLLAQVLITTYGLISLGVVGLLIYTLVMTNVQEQRREMAILRILGSERGLLFRIVIAEVLAIGAAGVGLGVVLGQAITSYLVIPFIDWQLNQDGLTIAIEPVVTLAGIFPAVASAFVVLVVSAAKPAQDAARTKVLHAINPNAADNIQLEDLDHLRERRPSVKLFLIGLAMMLVMVLIFGLGLVETLGSPAAEAAIILIAVLMMVVGLVFTFFIFTRPLERVILFLAGLMSPRLTYFAKRNVNRGTERNTLISLLVLFSAVLPSFLATQLAVSGANLDTTVRLDMGAPVSIQSVARWAEPEFAPLFRLQPAFLSDELASIAGVEHAVGLTYEYRSRVTDVVGMRRGELTLLGVDGDLNDVLFDDVLLFAAGGPEALTQLQADPTAIIISEGMALGLAVPLGGTITVQGEGLDHDEALTVAGIARRIPGIDGIGRVRNQAMNGGTALISLAGFNRLTTDPLQAAVRTDAPVLDRVLATVSADSDPKIVRAALNQTLNDRYDLWIRLFDLELEQAVADQAGAQVLLLALTLISFTTAVFGVFAVIYVTIYSRRKEIGMLKAVGARSWELNGMLTVESIAMTLSAAMAGILAGVTMGYLFAFIENASAQRPQQFAVDTTVAPFIIIMVVLAAIVSTLFSARRIVKRKAVEIMRMS